MAELDYARDFPAFEGRTVTQGHADYCAANGHATLQGVSPFCHRCGAEVKPDDRAVAIARQIVDASQPDPIEAHLWLIFDALAAARAAVRDGNPTELLAEADSLVDLTSTLRRIAAQGF